MIVVHNNNKPRVVQKPVQSTIVDDPGEKKQMSKKYGAYAKSSAITWADPTSIVEENTSDVAKLADSRMDVINRARTLDIAIAAPSNKLIEYVSQSGEMNLLTNSKFGNWREYSVNKFATISQRVMLVPDKVGSGGSLTWANDNAGKTILKSGAISAITNTIQKLNDVANGVSNVVSAATGNKTKTYSQAQKFSRWYTAPVVKLDEPPTVTPSIKELKFTFKFGQAGLFSAEEEVVKPILALASIYLPMGSVNGGVTAPYPTAAWVKGKAVAALIGQLKNAGSGLRNMFSDGMSDDMNLLEKANQFAGNLMGVVDNVASSAYGSASTLTVIVGGNVQGPFFVPTVSWDFDFTQVDEFGYPCSGTLTYGGLLPIFVNTGSDVVRQWGYKIGTISDSNLTDAVASNIQQNEEVTGSKEYYGTEGGDVEREV